MRVTNRSRTLSREEECPLSLRIRLDHDDPVYGAALADLRPLKRKTALAAEAIIANFRINAHATVFYSRDKRHYSDRAVRLYYPDYYTYASVTSAVDALVAAGLVEERRTAPSPQARIRSTLRAAPGLRDLVEQSPFTRLQSVATELIVLRTAGKSKRWLPYDDTDEIRAMRADAQAQNDFQASFFVDLIGAASPHPMLSLPARLYRRIFAGDFEQGGRWYALWQNIERQVRPQITIDGSPTYEFDYSCCHPRILCAIAGLDLPFGVDDFDFYSSIPGFDRTEVKAAVARLLNAGSVRSAEASLAIDILQSGQSDSRARARALCRAIRATWPQLSTYWCTGIGLRLQRIDSDICTDVQAEMRARGIPVLSIHDGFIVPAEYGRVLTDSAMAGMETACRRLREHPIGISVGSGT